MKTKILYILILAVIYSLQINFAREKLESTSYIESIQTESVSSQIDSPCPVESSYFHNPPDGTFDVPILGTILDWVNGSGTVSLELWFGPAGNVVKVYDGPAIISYNLPTLVYNTTYNWYVVCKNDTCGTQGPTNNFLTMQSPTGIFFDPFTDFNNWTILGPSGTANWSVVNSNLSGGNTPELRLSWTPSFVGVSKIRSVNIALPNNILVSYSFNFFFDWYANPSGSITVGVTYDGGMTTSDFYTLTDPTENVGPAVISGSFVTPGSGSQNTQIEIKYDGNSFNIDNIYFDNMRIEWCLSCYPPSSPSNLTAQVIFDPGPKVQLGWQDNSWNENGFRIYRKRGYPGSQTNYILVGVTLISMTQFIDGTVLPESTYTYKIIAYNDFGENSSNTTTIAVPVPVELISFAADVDGNVVTLFWQTATEMNNQGFEIERARLRSSNYAEASWERIGFVEGKGTTTEIQSYSFTDKPEAGIYKYRLKQIDFDGSFAYSPEVEAEVKAPNVFSLEQNYPNPFNPSTKIKYTIPASSLNPFSKGEGTFVTLKVFDILGNEVATLVNEEQTPGVYEIEFNSVGTSRDLSLPSGVYFYQLKAGGYIQSKKMILLK